MLVVIHLIDFMTTKRDTAVPFKFEKQDSHFG